MATMQRIDGSLDLVAQARSVFETYVLDTVVIQHVQQMVALLESWEVRTPVLAAAWLVVIVKHDTLLDANLTTRFGSRTTQLARLAVKLIFFEGNGEAPKRLPTKAHHAELARRLFVYAYADYEAVLIAVADQLATAEQYHTMSDAEQQDWAQRNQNVYMPLLEMLGLWQQRSALGNVTLQVINRGLYDQLVRQVTAYRNRHEQYYTVITSVLNQLLHTNQIEADIRLHVTSPASLYKRAEKAHRRGEAPKADDLNTLYIDLLLDDELACYTVLGIIHTHWKPALRRTNRHAPDAGSDSRFYDYIAAPRYNGYRSLITAVLVDFTPDTPDASPIQQLVEFRIRTYQMEQVNTHGITAAMLDPDPIKNAWWTDQTVRDAVKPGSTGHLTTITDLCVFTPIGEVIYPLRSGATMLDLAFKIHSALGPYAKTFWLNGKAVAHDSDVHHRDLIEIDYDLHYPGLQPDWEDKARLPSTKASIRRYLKQRERAPQRGRRLIDEVLQREMAIYRIRFPADKIQAMLTKIAHDYNAASVDALYLRVADGIISPDEVVAALFEAEFVPYIALADGDAPPVERIKIAQTWMQDKEPRKWERSSRVLPGVEIVGKYSGGRDKHRTLLVYRRDARQAPSADQAVALIWRSPEMLREGMEISVTAQPRSHIIGMVFNAIHGIGKDDEQQRITVHRFDAELLEGQLTVNTVVDAPSATSLTLLQDSLTRLQRNHWITDFQVWQLFPGHKVMLASRADKRQQNPFTLRQVGSRSMFYGRRDELQRVMDTIREGHLVVLYGQKRIGKTSLLNQLANMLNAQYDDLLPVLFDAHSVTPFDTPNFLVGLIDAARDRLTDRLKRTD
ncbi:MAG: HD domain-containing protein, partial [Armatimonadetes bacterium]|nr:HD domain-containing protein [Anaerolineae bacterium]